MDAANQIIYIQYAGKTWKRSPDGDLLPLEPGDKIPPDAQVFNVGEDMFELDENGELFLIKDDKGDLLPEPLVIRFTVSVGESEEGFHEAKSGNILGLLFNVERDAHETLAHGGYNSHGITVDRGLFGDRDGGEDDDDEIVGNIEISINIEDGGDGFSNRFESPMLGFNGVTRLVQEGASITLTVTDINGVSLTFTTTVTQNSWSINNADLSSLAEGQLTATATVDSTANSSRPVDASASTIKDTLAQGETLVIDDGADGSINLVELEAGITVNGNFSNVQQGALVTLIVTDSNGLSLTLTTTLDANGNWSLAAIDLSKLADGELIFEASSIDQAGNPASISASTIKDVLAEITVNIDDGGDNDGFTNAAEQTSINITGTTTGIEDGQIITVLLTDGVTTQTFTTTVISGGWSINNVDVSTLNEGGVVATATVSDVAGNQVSGQDTTIKDTIIGIGVLILDGGDEFINDAEVTGLIRVGGLVAHVEDGQTITVTLTSSGGGAPVVVTAPVAGFVWEIDNIDISSLTDGTITAQASVTDIAGNTAIAADTSVKDTLIDITVNMLTGGDGINNAEASNFSVAGTVNNVEDGQTITLFLLSSANGNLVTVTTVVAGGFWQIDGIDISALGDGLVLAQAEVGDVAGNTTFALDLSIKNTVAQLDVTIVDGGDELINGQEVSHLISVVGGTVDVANGQTITVTLASANGGAPVVVTTLVSGGIWQIDNIDISSLGDGLITAVANVVDIFGNPATAQDTSTKDTLAAITVTIDDGGDGFINSAEVTNLISAGGSVSNIENGQTVSVVFTSTGGGTPVVGSATVIGGNWKLNGVDISGLGDGLVVAHVSVKDVAGNTATADDNSTKDTQASISITIEDGGDELINGVEQVAPISLSGTVTDIENGQLITVTINSAAGGAPINLSTTVTGSIWRIDNIDVSAFSDGLLTATVSVTDIAGNTVTGQDTSTIDTFAEITVAILDGGDELLNDAEVTGLISVGGAVNGVEDNQTVSVTLTSAGGGTPVLVTGTVIGGNWQIDNVDISGLGEGVITANASVSDLAGNPASAQDTSVKDTQAAITVTILDGGDEFVNNAEVIARISVSGTVTDVEDGQMVSVTLTSAGGGVPVVVNGVVAGGIWQIDNVDISALGEGLITADANVSDVAGNPATAQDTSVKDTLSAITVNIIDGGDELISAAEVTALVSVGGTVSNVENGQSINVTLSSAVGGTPVVLTTTVSGGTWQIDNVDVSGFSDGTITASVSVTDVAGNTATAQDTSVKDTSVNIDFDTSVSSIDYGAMRADSGVTLTIATDAEDGQIVTVSVEDGTTTLLFTGAASGGTVDITLANGVLSSLDTNVSWTMTATVSDLAGNTAVDDLPTIILPDGTLLLEEGLIGGAAPGVGISDLSNLMIQGADNFTFSASQTDLLALTSQGSAVILNISVDGKTLTLSRTSDGADVLVATINPANTVTTELKNPLDHAPGQDNLTTKILVDGTQNDSDGSTDIITAPVVIDITDSQPRAQNDSETAVEAVVTTGNFLTNDNAVETPLVLSEVNVGGDVRQLSTASPVTTYNLAAGILRIELDGSWTLTANRNLDHSGADPVINLSYITLDVDGDSDTADASITISDGAAGNIADDTADITEGTVATVTMQSGTVFGNSGSDDLDPATIIFGVSTVADLTALTLTSDGEAISYSLSPDNKTLTAQTVSHNPVFVVTVSALANGNNIDITTDFSLSRPLDHISSDDLILTLPLAASDNDGTVANEGSIAWNLHDGNDIGVASSAGITLNETALPDNGTGTLNITAGSDEVVSLGFAATGLQPDVTSSGVVVQYQISNGGLTLTGFTVNPGDPVFVVTLSGTLNTEANSTLSYTMDLFKALDQLDTNGNPLVSEALPLVVEATDGDGDITRNTLDITVNDGNPPILGAGVLTVTEIPADPVAGIGFSQTASTTLSVDAGSDAIVKVGFNLNTGDAVVDSNGNAVTQAGNVLSWRDNSDGTLDAITSSGQVVFTATLPNMINITPGGSSIITFSYNQLQGIDHLANPSGQQQQLAIDIPVIVTDSDGTTATQNVTATVVDGDFPALSSNTNIGGNENSLLTGNIDISGSVNLTQGSDAIASITVDVAAFDAQGLTSSGLAITLTAPGSANGFWLAKDSGGTEIFRIRFNTNGQVDFIQINPLDHPVASADPIVGADDLPIVFKLTATDVDGDDSNVEPYTVIITDDIPDAANIFFTTTEGANISGNLFTTAEAGADGASIKANSIVYDGVTYTTGDSINLLSQIGGVSVGTLVINADGSATLMTVSALAGAFTVENVIYTIIDGDGDEQIRFLGFVIEDESGAISITPTNTNEDVPLTLTLTATAGDIDNGEVIITVLFDIAALAGGTLELDGVELSINAGNYELTNLVLTGGANGEVAPNGVLVYIPATDVSDFNVSPQFITSTLVNLTIGMRTDVHAPIDISISSVADVPIWNDTGSTFIYALTEDDLATNLTLDANLKDLDGSEILSYRINNINPSITLTLNGAVVNNGDLVNESELNQIQATVDENVGGALTFDVTAIATEQDNNDSAEVTKVITLNVTPVADQPAVLARSVVGTEDVAIDLSTMVTGALADLDGSETLSFQIDVPAGWTVTGPGVVANGANSFIADATEVANGNVMLVPLADISSVDNGGGFDVTFTAIATESTQGGIAPNPVTSNSPAQTVTVTLKGVADAPDIGGGANWNFNGTDTITSNGVNEDSLIALDFTVATQDDQSTEDITLLISNLPDGVIIVDASGVQQFLSVVGISGGKAVFQTTATQLNSLFLKTGQDFSGDISFNLQQINTEPDGNSASFNLTVNIPVTPVVDTVDGQTIASSGVEDTPIVLNFNPVLGDIDGSESLTGVVIDTLPAGAILLLDGMPEPIPLTGLDLSSLAAGLGLTLIDFINSGRLTLQLPEDAAGTFTLAATLEITDDAGNGTTTVSNITVNLDATATPLVEDGNAPAASEATRLENTGVTLTANGGVAIDLTGEVNFFDGDNDGSEVIDYIVIIAPNATDWFITHPNGAIHDGGGRWLIPATGLSDSGIKESAADILAGASITGSTITGPVDFTVEVRVLDGADAAIRSTTVSVEILSNAASTFASNPDTLQLSVIDGQEGSAVDTSGRLDTDIINPADVGQNDIISFRVSASSFDARTSISISGPGVIVDYAADGKTVIAWVFTEAAIPGLIINIGDDDFAGTLDIPVSVVATDPSGDSITDAQVLTVDVAPVVDGVTLDTNIVSINEDTATTMNFAFNFSDSNELNEGIETVDAASIVILSTPDGGSLNGTPAGIVSDNLNGTWNLLDNSRLDEVVFTPPLNASGDFRVTATVAVVDTATLSTGVATDNAVFIDTITVTVNPVTDSANLIVMDVSGNEDGDIALTGFSINLIDNDGSEQSTVTLSGVPEGAIVKVSGVQQANNGTDGGNFEGSPTFTWSFAGSDLANITITPPLNFSGDIPLTLNVLTLEQGNTDAVITSDTFTLGVNPVADGVQIRGNIDTVTANEGDVVTVPVLAESLEVDGLIVANETLQLTVMVNTVGSDASAIAGLDRIRVGGIEANFNAVAGGFEAILLIPSDQMSQFELLAGSDAFGNLDITVGIASVDTNTVLGSPVSDTSSDTNYNLTVTLDPLPTAPILTVVNESIIAAGDNIPLNLSMSLVNPAPGETGSLSIANLPPGLILNAGTEQGGIWTVDQADIASLTVSGGNGETFTLLLTPSATLNGNTVSGAPVTLSMQTQADGLNTLDATLLDDLFIGGNAEDTFAFSDGALVGVGLPSKDTISDFDTIDDAIDLTGISAVIGNNGAALDAFIDISETGGNTILQIKPDTNNVTQEIILQGVSIADLGGGANDAAILDDMLANMQLTTNS